MLVSEEKILLTVHIQLGICHKIDLFFHRQPEKKNYNINITLF